MLSRRNDGEVSERILIVVPYKTAPGLTRAALLCATTLAALCATMATAQTIPPTQDPSPPVAQDGAPAAATSSDAPPAAETIY